MYMPERNLLRGITRSLPMAALLLAPLATSSQSLPAPLPTEAEALTPAPRPIVPPPSRSLTWFPVNGIGASGPVTLLMEVDPGRLFVAGSFSQIAGASANRVALGYAETFFTNMSSGLDQTPAMGIWAEDAIYLALAASNGTVPKMTLKYWTEQAPMWNGIGIGGSDVGALLTALHVHDETFWLGTTIISSFGVPMPPSYTVENRMPNGWPVWPSPYHGTFNGPVRAFATFNGELVAAGDFTELSQLPTAHVAVYDTATNTWSQLADGLNANVSCLVEQDGVLYAGGIIDPESGAFGLARLVIGSDTWEYLMPDQQDYFVGEGEVHTILMAPDGSGYFGGSFTMAGSHGSGTNLASFGLLPNDIHPAADFNGPVHALAFSPFGDPSVLFAGGAFTMNGGEPMPYFAQTTITTGIREAADKAPFTLSPNPAHERLRVCLEGGPAGRALRVMDAMGRIVVDSFTDGPCTELDVAHLSAGTYVVQLENGRSTRTAAFVRR